MSDVVAVLWSDEPRRKPGPRPRFTIDDVVGAAIAIADAEGLDAVTMQRVADELGAAKMGVYRYVSAKEELAALMLDRALGDPPSAGTGPWQSQLRAWALAMHERMSARPWTLELTVGRRTPGPRELAWFEYGLAALRGTPLDGPDRMDVLAVLANHVRGGVQQEAGATEPEQALLESFQQVLAAHADRFPETVAAFAAAQESGRQDNALRFGIERILEGVTEYVARAGREA
ncbi:TetR/AcrR family transcriptional regulator [Jiangella mangrovi]|uniref:AcrR family transcriptional regulator n=1 Tax=Jiangella mangrovi TaxID=1524084 RepID=A0A7W9GKK1_9ACTN|nr:TetR/AcrR family transcriptional regulator [Jiangella mangrovi]MBB5785523.1 AcrR family transcriptional regulator [Jiangella mangrovi]